MDITLIDRRNFHLFQPLMYQVATGSLSPGEIAAPLRSVLSKQKNVRVLLGEAVDVDPATRTVILADGGRFGYDTLIVATGSETSYYGNDDWKEWAPSIKTIEEATAVRHKILYAFEAAERACDPAAIKAWLTFIIVGAGATGLELAGALAEIARETLRHDFRAIRPQEAQIILIETAPRVLPPYPADLSAKAEKSLRKLGVDVRTSVKVVRIDATGVTVQGDAAHEHIPARTVLWAGGIVAAEFGKRLGTQLHAETDRAGRIKVLPDLTVPGHPEIYIIGDLALGFRAGWAPTAGRGASGDAGRELRGAGDSCAAQGRQSSASFPLFRQRRHGGNWPSLRRSEHFRPAHFRVPGVVHLAIHPLAVHRRFPKQGHGVRAVGILVSHLQPWGTADYRTKRHGCEVICTGRVGSGVIPGMR